MYTSNVNNYVSGVSGSNSSVSSKSGNSTLDTTDFLKLLATQLANQDVSNPTDSTQFVSQMAQFTSLQAMQSMQQTANTQYSASLVGKKVVVSAIDGYTGKQVTNKGIVSSVQLSSGTTTIKINGKGYDISAVTQVLNNSGNVSGYVSAIGGATINFGTMGKDFQDYTTKVQYRLSTEDVSKTVGVVADAGKKQILVTLDATGGTSKLPTMADLEKVLQGTWTWQKTTNGSVDTDVAPTGFDSKKMTVSEAASAATKDNIVLPASSGSVDPIYG